MKKEWIIVLSLILAISLTSSVHAAGFFDTIKNIFGSENMQIENVPKVSLLKVIEFIILENTETPEYNIEVENKKWNGILINSNILTHYLTNYKNKDGDSRWCVGFIPNNDADSGYAATYDEGNTIYSTIFGIYVCYDNYRDAYELLKNIKNISVISFSSDECYGYLLDEPKTINVGRTLTANYSIKCYIDMPKAFSSPENTNISIYSH